MLRFPGCTREHPFLTTLFSMMIFQRALCPLWRSHPSEKTASQNSAIGGSFSVNTVTTESRSKLLSTTISVHCRTHSAITAQIQKQKVMDRWSLVDSRMGAIIMLSELLFILFLFFKINLPLNHRLFGRAEPSMVLLWNMWCPIASSIQFTDHSWAYNEQH